MQKLVQLLTFSLFYQNDASSKSSCFSKAFSSYHVNVNKPRSEPLLCTNCFLLSGKEATVALAVFSLHERQS